VSCVAGLVIAVVGFALPLPAGLIHTPVAPGDVVLAQTDELLYTATVLTLGEGEYSYTYKANKPVGRCSVITSGKNKGKFRCCSVITSGKNKGKKRCTISNRPNKPVTSNPVTDIETSPKPAIPADQGPTYSVDPVSLEFEGPLMGSESAYAFLSLGSNGVPARWNKCKTVRYRVNPNGLPPLGLEDTQEAIRRLSLASQIRFEYVGPTSVIPYATNDWYSQVPTNERRSTELWITFTDESSIPALAGSTIGIGGPVWQEASSGKADAQIIAGGISLKNLLDIEPGFGSGAKRGSLLMHELGHVMNLGHVGESVQIMYPELVDETKSMYQNGDLAGFRQLHSYPCF
jgi:hypothetical protein